MSAYRCHSSKRPARLRIDSAGVMDLTLRGNPGRSAIIADSYVPVIVEGFPALLRYGALPIAALVLVPIFPSSCELAGRLSRPAGPRTLVHQPGTTPESGLLTESSSS